MILRRTVKERKIRKKRKVNSLTLETIKKYFKIEERKNQLLKNIELTRLYRSQGKKQKEIAEILNLKIRQIQNYCAEIKKTPDNTILTEEEIETRFKIESKVKNISNIDSQLYAQTKVRLLKKESKIDKQEDSFCFDCGKSGKEIMIHWHHIDYNFPEVVIPLCAKCHKRYHKYFKVVKI